MKLIICIALVAAATAQHDSSASQGEAKVCSRRGVRYEGDYVHAGEIRDLRNWEQCRSRCDENIKCVGWTFMTSTRTCKLFSRGVRAIDDKLYVSGDKMACQKCNSPKCFVACPQGYKLDSNGCATCDCLQTIPASANSCSRTGVKYEGDYMIGENIRNVRMRNWEECRTRCDQNTRCAGWTFMTNARSCELFSGVVRMQDDNRYVSGDRMACQRCDRNRPPMCYMACPGGYQKDSNDCAICACMSPVCNTPKCFVACPQGYKRDSNGCETCDCLQGTKSCSRTGVKYEGDYMIGENTRNVRIRNWEECRTRCDQNTRCVGWTFMTNARSCELFSRVVRMQDDNRYVSGDRMACQRCDRNMPPMCYMACPGGYQKDSNGCAICACISPGGLTSLSTIQRQLSVMSSRYETDMAQIMRRLAVLESRMSSGSKPNLGRMQNPGQVYRLLKSGKCTDLGMSAIRGVTACNMAAIDLGLEDREAEQGQGFQDWPDVCYYLPNNPATNRLWVSYHANARGRWPLCEKMPQFRYKMIETGRCHDNNMLPIRDESVCSAAAKALGLEDDQAATHPFPYYPEGCYYIADDPKSQRLWLSTNLESKNGADNRRRPICKAMQ